MKKVFSLFLSMVMVIGIITSFPISVNATQSRVENFNKNYSLTGNLAYDIASIAEAQIGKSGASFGYTEDWCADFVSDCARSAGISTSVIPYTGGVVNMYNAILSNGGYKVSAPQRGDLVFYWTGSYWCHVAVMVDSVNSVHGNVNGQSGNFISTSYVTKCKYSAYNEGTATFIRPNYGNVSVPVSVSYTAYPEKQSIGETNAVLSTIITTTGTTVGSISSVGIHLYDKNGTLIGSKSETPITSGDHIKAWYDVNSELGCSLSPGTNYTYKFFAVIGGTTYYSNDNSFTTTGTAVCQHNYETTTVNATCASEGYTTYKCSYCEHTYTETIPKSTNHSSRTTSFSGEYSSISHFKCSTCGDEWTYDLGVKKVKASFVSNDELSVEIKFTNTDNINDGASFLSTAISDVLPNGIITIGDFNIVESGFSGTTYTAKIKLLESALENMVGEKHSIFLRFKNKDNSDNYNGRVKIEFKKTAGKFAYLKTGQSVNLADLLGVESLSGYYLEDYNTDVVNYNSGICTAKKPGKTTLVFAHNKKGNTIGCTFTVECSEHVISGKVIKEATCNSTGLKVYTCSVCGNVVGSEIIPKSNVHNLSSWIIDKEATLNSPGSKHKECTECKKVLETQVVPQLKCANPELKSVSNTVSGVKSTWSAVDGADSYRIYRQIGSGEWALLKEDLTSTTYIDTAVTSGTTYKYKVRAYNEAGLSDNHDNYKTIKFLSVPKVSMAANVVDGMKVQWNAVKGANKYYVYRRGAGGDFKHIKTVTTTSYIDKSINKNNGYVYWYTIKAGDGTYISSYYGETSPNVIKTKRLSAPRISSTKNVASGIEITWNKIGGAKGYNVYRKTGSSDYKYIGKTTSTKYVDTSVKNSAGKVYEYTVRATYDSFISSFYNKNAPEIKRLIAPSLTRAVSGKSGITLKWSKSTSVSGYVVYRQIGNGKLTKLATVKGATKVSYTDKSAKKGTKYTYKLKAYSGKTYSAYSNAKTIKDKY